MKKFFKILLITIVILFAIIAVLPYVFKAKIIEVVQTEVNSQVNANITFGDLELSLFKSFPDFCLSMKNLSVSGLAEFEGDTLAYLPNIEIDIDLFKMIKGSTISVKRIRLDDPIIYVKVLKGGAANYDIALVSEETESEISDTTSSDMVFSLKDFQINHGILMYDDYDMDMLFAMNDMNLGVSGDFTESTTDASISGSVAALDFVYEGMAYLAQTQVLLDINLLLDLDQFRFTFKENSVSLNDFPLTLNGWLAMPDEDIDMDLQLSSPGSEFKPLLSLIPVVYMNDFEAVETFGKISFSAYVKGLYTDTELPGFNLDLRVEKALFKYPDLPRSAENINIDLNIVNPGGDEDNTIIDIRKFHADLGQNPFDMNLIIKTPVSDPLINGQITANIDFSTLQDVIPLEDTEIKGVVDASLKLMGQLSSIEKEEYHDFAASGRVKLDDFSMNSPDLPDGMLISRALLDFNPEVLVLSSFDAMIGNNDISLQGSLQNYLPYFFKEGEILKGVLAVKSRFMDLNELMGAEEAGAESADTDTSAMGVIEIPKDLDFILTASMGKVKYALLEIDQLNGIIKLKNGKAELEKLGMDMLGGNMLLNGYYDSYDIANPQIDFGISITDFDIPSTYKSFVTIKKLAPIARYAEGKISAQLSVNSLLQKDMIPDLSSMNSAGSFSSDNISLKNSPFFEKLSEQLKGVIFKEPGMKNVAVDYVLKDGTLELKPFKTKIGNSDALITSNQKIDGTLDCTIAMGIPKSSFSVNGTNMLPNGISKYMGDKINLDVLVGGTISDPKFSLNLKDAGGSVVSGIKETVKEQVNEKIDEQKEKAKDAAKQRASKIIADAEKKAEQIKAEARKGSDKIVSEADAQAKKLEDAAEGKSFIEKNIAKKAAEKIRKEAKVKADQLVTEADKKAAKIINDAKKEAEKL